MSASTIVAAVVAGLLSSVAFGAELNVRDPNGYERVLLPVYLEVPVNGAQGSVWVTELAVRNEGDVPVQAFQNDCDFFCTCSIPLCSAGGPMEPRGPLTALLIQENVAKFPIFLYVQRTYAANVAFNLRVRDISRSDHSLGTELPVVRESEFLTRPSYLLNVPIEPLYRNHLRLFGISSESGAGDIRVRIVAENGTEALYERVMSLIPPSPFRTVPRAGLFPMTPAWADLPNFHLLPALAGAGPVRIELTPLSSGLVYWAYAAITNLDTQQITTVTPQ